MNHANAFSLHMFFPSGDPDGLRIVKKDNWSGRAIALKREGLDEAIERTDLDRTGVYVLRGEEGEEPRLYVGETIDMIGRLKTHASDEDFWTEVVLFVREGDELDKADVLYLEARLVEMAQGNCVLENTQKPDAKKILGSDKADKVAAAEGFLEEMLLSLRALGYREFESSSQRTASSFQGGVADGDALEGVSDERGQEEPLRLLTCARGGVETEARGRQLLGGGFVVLKGSTGLVEQAPSLMNREFRAASARRQQVLESDQVARKASLFELTADIEFSSPSQAESVVAGRPGSGLANWKIDGEASHGEPLGK